jgi:FkbM family methyltransferase
VERTADSALGKPNDDVIVIPSHVTGMPFLINLLESFGDYDKYPILIVINEYKEDVEPSYQEILRRFGHLPLTLGRVKSNSFEFGGLLYAYDQTQYENFFLLPHSCEIVDPKIFDVAFEEFRHRSVAFFLRKSLSGSGFWESHIGKYRREVLTALDFKKYQPHNIYEATFVSEMVFTHAYHEQDPSTHAMYTLFEQTGEVTEKFGKPRLKMATPYLIKWKTHWSALMIFKSFPKKQKGQLIYCLLRYALWTCRTIASRTRYLVRESFVAFRNGAPWSPRYHRWRKQLANHPELKHAAHMVRRCDYNEMLIQFCVEGVNHLHDHVLDQASLVLDVGAFDGEYAEKLYRRYQCEIHCFEPIPEFCRRAEQRFRGNPRVHVHQTGLSDRTYSSMMSMRGLGSSEFGFALRKRPVHMKDVSEVFATLDRDVDLLKINIEGGEYPLLKRMLEQDLLRRCKKVLVQFHDKPISARLARKLRSELIAGIEKTHNPTFSYPFVWEGWERKPSVAQSNEIPSPIAQVSSQRAAGS